MSAIISKLVKSRKTFLSKIWYSNMSVLWVVGGALS
ncbi:hypothetical protein PALA111701_10715 [Paenibacillus lactis]